MSLPSAAASARVSRLLLAVLLVLLASLTTGSASAGSGCAQQIIVDWSDNGTIDGSYPTACYQQAIAALPEDLRSYSSAADDISRALQAALLAGVEENGGEGAVTGSSDSGSSSSQDGEAGAESEPSGGAGAATTEEEATPPAEGSVPPASEDPTVVPQAAAALEPGDDGAGLPVPIVVLLAVVGVAAVGFLVVAGVRLVRDRTGTGA